MKKSDSLKHGHGRISSPDLSRRRFISSCSACAACMALAPLGTLSSCSSGKKMTIRVLYSMHEPVQSQPDWPNVGFDFNPFMERMNSALALNFPDMNFIPAMAKGPEEAEKIAAAGEADAIDGYIVFQLNCWNQVVQSMAKTGKPVIFADFQFGGSGGFLVYTADFIRKGTGNLGFVASSRPEDLMAAVGCFRTIQNSTSPGQFAAAVAKTRIDSTKSTGSYSLIPNSIQSISAGECAKRLGKSKILAVRDQNREKADPVLGIPLEYIPFSEINDAWSIAGRDESAAVAERWKKTAAEVIGVNDDTLLTSAAMYLGMKSVLKKHNANAITVNCLGGFYGGHIHAYPCLGFHELCNEGLIGACECDVRSTASMVALTTMTEGRPGFISDPVLDTSKRRIIYAHCVAPNRMFGPAGETNAFRIMTHSEDRQGASVQSVLPVNYMTTSIQVNNEAREILLHQAVALDNDPDDRACRTKLSAEPLGDFEKLFTMWDKWGWHRVTFYGDLKQQVYDLASVSGFKVIEEA